MDDEINFFMRRYTLEIVLRKSIDDQNVLQGTWSFKCKRKPDWTISKFKAQYCVRGDFHKILSTEPLNSYSPVIQWATVSLMLIFQCIMGLQIKSIDFTSDFSQAYITSEEPVFIELPRDLKSDG